MSRVPQTPKTSAYPRKAVLLEKGDFLDNVRAPEKTPCCVAPTAAKRVENCKVRV